MVYFYVCSCLSDYTIDSIYKHIINIVIEKHQDTMFNYTNQEEIKISSTYETWDVHAIWLCHKKVLYIKDKKTRRSDFHLKLRHFVFRFHYYFYIVCCTQITFWYYRQLWVWRKTEILFLNNTFQKKTHIDDERILRCWRLCYDYFIENKYRPITMSNTFPSNYRR
jgi:hypothetical protein